MIRVEFKKLENNNLEITEKTLNDILSYMKRQGEEIRKLNYLFFLYGKKLHHISKDGIKKYYKENIKLVIEEMERLKDGKFGKGDDE